MYALGCTSTLRRLAGVQVPLRHACFRTWVPESDFGQGDVERWRSVDQHLQVVGMNDDGVDQLLDRYAVLGWRGFLPERDLELAQ